MQEAGCVQVQAGVGLLRLAADIGIAGVLAIERPPVVVAAAALRVASAARAAVLALD